VKLKLDENIGRSGLKLLQQAGHDVVTVADQELGGIPDQVLIDLCRKEGRGLVTLSGFCQPSSLAPRQVCRNCRASPAGPLQFGRPFRGTEDLNPWLGPE